MSTQGTKRAMASQLTFGAQSRPRPQYSISTAKAVVTVKFTGMLAGRDIADYAVALRANPEFRATFSEVVDLREVEETDLDAAQALQLADYVDPFAPNSKRAFVAQSEVQVNVARMHILLRGSPDNIRIFCSLSHAERWIEERT